MGATVRLNGGYYYVFTSHRLRKLRSVRETQAAVDGTDLPPWVFPALIDPLKPLNASWFWRHVWEPLLRKAEIRHVRVHDARHSYASLMLRRGVPVAYVSRQLGHSSIQVTVDLYGHFIPGEDRHHVEGLAEAIEAASGSDVQLRATNERSGKSVRRVSHIYWCPRGDSLGFADPLIRPFSGLVKAA